MIEAAGRNAIRAGLFGWSFSAGLALIGFASAAGLWQSVGTRGYSAIPLVLVGALIVRTAMLGVSISADGRVIARDWLRTREFPPAYNVTIGRAPYAGFVNAYRESPILAVITIQVTEQPPHKVRSTVASFRATKRRQAQLQVGMMRVRGVAVTDPLAD